MQRKRLKIKEENFADGKKKQLANWFINSNKGKQV